MITHHSPFTTHHSPLTTVSVSMEGAKTNSRASNGCGARDEYSSRAPRVHAVDEAASFVRWNEAGSFVYGLTRREQNDLGPVRGERLLFRHRRRIVAHAHRHDFAAAP